MIRSLSMLVVLAAVGSAFAGGFVLKEENDFFAYNDTDRYYTQGLELQYVEDPVLTNGVITRNSYGLRNIFYTPQDITIAEPQPDDRPWAGLTAVSITEWTVGGNESKMSEWLMGTVGEWSQSDHIQSDYHRAIHNKIPMGWTNQIPNEPILNYTEDHYREKYMWGFYSGWGFDVVQNFGYSVGNAFVYGDAGYTVRAGWGIPKDCKVGILEPTLVRGTKYSCYLFTAANGKLMLHNITLGGSLFQDGPCQELKPLVVDVIVGLSGTIKRLFGNTDFGVSYVVVQRSKEYEGQDDPQRFGSVALSFTRGF